MGKRVYGLLFFAAIALAMVLLTGVCDVRAEQTAASALKAGMVDDFESGAITNLLGGRTNVYVKAPSKVMVSFRKDTINGKPTNVLLIRYDKKAEGGPNDLGGWCGYYTVLKSAHPDISMKGATPAEIEEVTYLDGSRYSKVTMLVKGDKGSENFVVGLADAHWDKMGDSIKSQEIGKFLPSGKITTDWQKAVIPFEEFFLDYSKLSSISISFESDCFPEGIGSGKVYIDDITLE